MNNLELSRSSRNQIITHWLILKGLAPVLTKPQFAKFYLKNIQSKYPTRL